MPPSITSTVLADQTNTSITFIFAPITTSDATYVVEVSGGTGVVSGHVSGTNLLTFVTDSTLLAGVEYTFNMYTVLTPGGGVDIRSVPYVQRYYTCEYKLSRGIIN